MDGLMTAHRVFLVLGLLLLCNAPVAASQSATSLSLPEILSAEIPAYPYLAYLGRIEGDVVLTVETDGEQIVRVSVSPDAHVLLAPSAEANIRTWRFIPHSPRSFQVTYRYRQVSGDFSLPERVVAFQWSVDEVVVEITERLGLGLLPGGRTSYGENTLTRRLLGIIELSCAIGAVESIDTVRDPTFRAPSAIDGNPWTIEAMPVIPMDVPEFFEVPEELHVEIKMITYFTEGPALATGVFWIRPEGSGAFRAFARQLADDLRDVIMDRCYER